MTFDYITTAECVNTSTTTSSTTTGTTTASTSTQSTSTLTTTTCVSVALATVSPSITSASQSLFGAFPAGFYTVNYMYGALKYGGSYNSFYLNATSSAGYLIVYNGGNNIIEGPNNGYVGFPSEQQVEQFNAGASVTFYHSGGSISMFLQDTPYSDNTPGTVANPTFRLYASCVTTTTAGTPTTTTSSTATTTSSTTTPPTTTFGPVNYGNVSWTTFDTGPLIFNAGQPVPVGTYQVTYVNGYNLYSGGSNPGYRMGPTSQQEVYWSVGNALIPNSFVTYVSYAAMLAANPNTYVQFTLTAPDVIEIGTSDYPGSQTIGNPPLTYNLTRIA